MKIEIREIKDKDNDKIKQVLVSVMTEFGVPDHGTALQDEELDSMSEAYKTENSILKLQLCSITKKALNRAFLVIVRVLSVFSLKNRLFCRK